MEEQIHHQEHAKNIEPGPEAGDRIARIFYNDVADKTKSVSVWDYSIYSLFQYVELSLCEIDVLEEIWIYMYETDVAGKQSKLNGKSS